MLLSELCGGNHGKSQEGGTSFRKRSVIENGVQFHAVHEACAQDAEEGIEYGIRRDTADGAKCRSEQSQ